MEEVIIKIELYTYYELNNGIKKKVFMDFLNYYGTDLLIDNKLKITKKFIEGILHDEDNLFFVDGEKAKIHSYIGTHPKGGIRELEFKKELYQLQEK